MLGVCKRGILVAALRISAAALDSTWEHVGPWNIFDDKYNNGESGTLACAASPELNPNVIYAGGQNNGVSSGILKTVDAGKHWVRKSKGLWDTRILGVWLHPNYTDGSYVFAGTHSGIYESIDGAESWTRCEETKSWGSVMSFRQGVIQKEGFILANSFNGILTRKMSGRCGWQKIDAPGGMPSNQHLSVNNRGPSSEILTCIGGWGGGDMYYALIESPSNASWIGPITTSDGEKIDCSNAAIDPNDRNHFLFSKGGEFRAYESKDGGRSISKFINHDVGSFFVMIDSHGWLYTATQDGAFVSQDSGASWNALHVVMTNRDGTLHDRVPHDYQRIVPDFRGDGIAIPSDQGLHIVNRSSYNLTNACGDLHNNMALSAIISPSSTEPGSRNLVVNLWDWNVGASWNDGATWAGWSSLEKAPGWCGEGGGGQGMGKSGKVVMFHRNHWAQSSDGGHNWMRGDAPGSPGGSFVYVRESGSRAEPSGTCFSLMDAPADSPPAPPPAPPPPPPPKPFSGQWVAMKDEAIRCSGDEFKGDKGQTNSAQDCLNLVKDDVALNYAVWQIDGHCYTCAIRDRGNLPGSWGFSKQVGATSFARPVDSDMWVPFVDEDDDDDEMDPDRPGPIYTPCANDYLDPDEPCTLPGVQPVVAGTVKFLMTSQDFGVNWNWTKMPDQFQAGALAVNPTSASSLFALTTNCLAHSTDHGLSWSPCIQASGLTGRFSALIIKDSEVMFMLRSGAVPLRTKDGGLSWSELSSASPLFKYGATMDGSLSWSGRTLVLHGVDLSAVDRGEFATSVWKSCDDGQTWIDEASDLVSISPGPGVWYEEDFYFVTRGEGVTVKRNFDCSTASVVI